MEKRSRIWVVTSISDNFQTIHGKELVGKRNIANQRVTIHCTVTGQIMQQPDYLEEFI